MRQLLVIELDCKTYKSLIQLMQNDWMDGQIKN